MVPFKFAHWTIQEDPEIDLVSASSIEFFNKKLEGNLIMKK
jgi:hypothetical protein